MSPVSVVLPDPDGPTRARVSPAPIASETSRSTRRSGQVCERHGVELDPAGDLWQIGCASGASTIVGRVSMISNTRVDRPGPLAELAVEAGDRPEARRDGHAVQQEPGQRADPERAVDDLVPRVPQQGRQGAEAEEAHQRAERGPPHGQARAGRHDAPQVGVVALELPFLADVALHDADARQRLLGGRRAARDGVLDLRADTLERPPEDDRHRDQRGRQEQHDEQQRRAEQ